MLAQAECEAICVCEFQEALGLKQPTVSYHLKQLIDAGVIARAARPLRLLRVAAGRSLERISAMACVQH